MKGKIMVYAHQQSYSDDTSFQEMRAQIAEQLKQALLNATVEVQGDRQGKRKFIRAADSVINNLVFTLHTITESVDNPCEFSPQSVNCPQQ